MKLPPYKNLYRLGREIEPHIPKNMKLEDIGKLTGQTRQSVYCESLVVLGKLVWLLRNAVNKD